MNKNENIEQQWSQLEQRYRQVRCPKSAEELEKCVQNAMKGDTRRGARRWRYAAAAALLAAVAGVGIAILTHPVPQHHYAYSETPSGVRIYCESGCNADDVLQQINETILTLN